MEGEMERCYECEQGEMEWRMEGERDGGRDGEML